MGDGKLIAKSVGHHDQAGYDRQVADGTQQQCPGQFDDVLPVWDSVPRARRIRPGTRMQVSRECLAETS
jgi:hypothetical protein